MSPTGSADTWLALTADELPVGEVYAWCVRPDCGAVVLFSGTVRDHAEGRPGVTHLEYEAYEEQVLARFGAIVDELRGRWPTARRVAVLHRIGRLEIGESSVVVAVSAPHRQEAFDAARFGIDAVKATAPIWKRESWAEGDAWGQGAHDIVHPAEVHAATEGP